MKSSVVTRLLRVVVVALFFLAVTTIAYFVYHMNTGAAPAGERPSLKQFEEFVDSHSPIVYGPLEQGSAMAFSIELRTIRDGLKREIDSGSRGVEKRQAAIQICNELKKAIDVRERHWLRYSEALNDKYASFARNENRALEDHERKGRYFAEGPQEHWKSAVKSLREDFRKKHAAFSQMD